MSDSEIKPININPELFKVRHQTKKKNNTLKKTKPVTSVRSKDLKKNLLDKIKNYNHNKKVNTNNIIVQPNLQVKDNILIQKQPPIISVKKSLSNNNTKLMNLDNSVINESDDYTSSINFLQELSKKKDKCNKFSKQTSVEDKPLEQNYESPKYGCLKNGTLPTYKQWKNKTLKKPNIEINTDNNTECNGSNNGSNIGSNKLRNLGSKTKTLKYYLGKRGRIVSILVKNSDTRKKITKEHNLLKQESIIDMKNYLKKRNLLKSGSNAPASVIKKMYEQALLGGDIKNSNSDNLIHNYLAE